VTKLDMKFGIQFPKFDAFDNAFEELCACAFHARMSGFDALFVMDHFQQLPMLGTPDQPMLEAYVTLAGVSARISDLQIGTLVTGVTYRNPALLAKEITALDLISDGPAILGIGAGWYEEEHRAFGFDFPPMKERFERLEDALHICKAMFTEEAPTYHGTHHSIENAYNLPGPTRPGGPPIMIGGSGEKRTLRLVAEHADASNLICGIDEIPHKLEVLQRHCDEVGRDRKTINVSWLGSLVIEDDDISAGWKLDRMLAGRPREAVANRMIWGGPDQVREQVSERLLGVGLDGVIVNLPADRIDDPDAFSIAGETLNLI
jgi:F420-dependent oxidoreductase-like protein